MLAWSIVAKGVTGVQAPAPVGPVESGVGVGTTTGGWADDVAGMVGATSKALSLGVRSSARIGSKKGVGGGGKAL